MKSEASAARASRCIVSFRQQCMIFWNNHALLPKAYEKSEVLEFPDHPRHLFVSVVEGLAYFSKLAFRRGRERRQFSVLIKTEVAVRDLHAGLHSLRHNVEFVGEPLDILTDVGGIRRNDV